MIPRNQHSTADPGPPKSSSGDSICRDFLWGICTKHTRCNKRHELDIEKLKEILKFCHDYQNRNGCTRANCRFIHATKEEENAFNATGQVPRVLAERHAALASASSSMSNAETIPQIAMFINESYMAQPPPAPWPPLPPAQSGAPPAGATGAPPPRLAPTPAPAPQPCPLGQQPPPPPRLAPSSAPQPTPHAHQPPPPPALSSAPLPTPASTLVPPSVHRINNHYHAPQNSMFPVNQPQPPMVPPEFDASMPPPPLPTTHKRKLDANGSDGAGPSKTRKDCTSADPSFCESCVERKRSIDGFKMQIDTLHNEEETQILLYKKKLQEYEMGRAILKSLVEPDLFRLFDDLIEGVQSPRQPLSLNSNNSSFLPLVVGGSIRNDPVPSTSREDDTQAARRLNYSNQSPDIVNLVMETFRNSTAQESTPSLEVRNETSDVNRLGTNRTNGLSHLANGQSAIETARYGMAPGYSGAGMVNQDFGAHALQAMPNYPVADSSGYGGAGPSHAPPPPAAYAMFHPAIPPPNRQYYGQNASPSNIPPTINYNGANRAPVPGPSQGIQPSTSSAPLRPTQANTPTYNQMGRHPQ